MLQSDKLQMDEVEILKHVKQWANINAVSVSSNNSSYCTWMYVYVATSSCTNVKITLEFSWIVWYVHKSEWFTTGAHNGEGASN